MLVASLQGGDPASFTIITWKVDNQKQTETTNKLQLALPHGEHQVEVEATCDGEVLRTRAKVKVTIQESGDVQVIPDAAPRSSAGGIGP